MADDVRREQFKHVTKIRELIGEEKLVLFIGEGLSALGETSSVDDWWKLVGDFKSHQETLFDTEETFVNGLQNQRSKAHDNIRMLGRFPLILTTNLDSLIERLLWKAGPRREAVRLDQANLLRGLSDKKRDFVVKCFGDYGVTTAASRTSKQLMRDLCEGRLDETNEIFQFFKKLFNERSVLFLGCDSRNPLYQGLLQRFAVPAKVRHFFFKEDKERTVEENGSLVTITLSMPVWEFTFYLNTGSKQTHFENGKTWEKFYLPSQREEYLRQQLVLEQKSTKITFLTSAITNGLATNEILEGISRPKLEDLFNEDPFRKKDPELVKGAYDAMVARRDNLVKTIEEGKVLVRAMFFLAEFKREISTGPETRRQKMIRKYANAALKCNSFLHSNNSFEIILIPTKDEDELKTLKKDSFAYLNLSGSTADAAVCYADPAGSGGIDYTINLIVVNGPEVQTRTKLIEQMQAKALNPEESLTTLVGMILQANREVNAFPHDDQGLRRLEQLDQLIGLAAGNEIDIPSLEKIGSGAFGTVYKGKWNGKTVAYKVIQESSKDADLQAFLREFDSLKRSRHPHIVQVENCFHSKSRFGFVMEYIEGANLWNIIQKGILPKDKVYKVGVAVAEALDHLHQMKIIHRDVKPDNILVGGDFEVIKLSDFGLARAMEATLESKTLLRGHWRYMAPEVMKDKRYTTKADVYSYGCVLIEMISRKQVFEEIDTNRLGLFRGELTPKIPKECTERYGLPLRRAIEIAIRPEKTRAEIRTILEMLEGKTREIPSKSNVKSHLEILCLGTGTGTTGIISGEPSSSFVLLYHGQPLLLVDLGFGVFRQYRRLLNDDTTYELPDKIFITHNHSDHAGELPPLLYLDARRRAAKGLPKVTIYSGPEVEKRLKEHRLVEQNGLPLPDGSTASPEQLANWVSCFPRQPGVVLDTERYVAIKVHRSRHTEICYGFVLYWKNKPLLGFSGDSGFDRQLYDELCVAPYVIVDARKNGTEEHASYEEVVDYFKDKFKCKVYITGYGSSESDDVPDVPGIDVFYTGFRLTLVNSLLSPEKTFQNDDKKANFPPSANEGGYPSTAESLQSLSQGSGTVH